MSKVYVCDSKLCVNCINCTTDLDDKGNRYCMCDIVFMQLYEKSFTLARLMSQACCKFAEKNKECDKFERCYDDKTEDN